MSPSHPGQLNTSHYSWHHSKGWLTPLTNHQSQSEKHPVTSPNPYMSNVGQHPHKRQEIELLERMRSARAIEEYLFIHSWLCSQTVLTGSKNKKAKVKMIS